ncbi:MAG: glycosyltransferase family 1 protein [Pirellulales bacterium]
MSLTINGRFLSQRVTGVQRYAREVLARGSQLANVVAPRRTIRGVRGHLWEQSILPARVGRSLLWSPCNTGPLAVARQVVTIHDCAFYDQPEVFSRRFVAWYRWLVPKLAQRIRRIITISNYSRERLLEVCRVAPEKVVVIPQGVEGRFRPLPVETVERTRAQLGLPPRYVLFVGALVPRKNLGRLLEAWKTVSPSFPELSLVLAGGSNQVFREAGLNRLPASVVTAGYVADEHLPAVYGGAELFVFPSLYEGFGLPVLEAMACGVPVLTSNVTSLPEVAGDAALYVDPYRFESIAEGLQTLLSDRGLHDELARRGIARASAYTWDRTAAVTWNVLQETARD